VQMIVPLRTVFSQLQKLNVEGNQLEGLPPGLLNLPLKQLDTEGNFMHALLWPGNTRNQPQVSNTLHLKHYYTSVV